MELSRHEESLEQGFVVIGGLHLLTEDIFLAFLKKN
jgi:hypothetical protein